MKDVLFMPVLPVIAIAICTSLSKDNQIETVQATSYDENNRPIMHFLGNITNKDPEGEVSDSPYDLEVNEKSVEAIASHLRHYFNRMSEKYTINLYTCVFDIGALSFFLELAVGNYKWVQPGEPCVITQVRLSSKGANSLIDAIMVLDKVQKIDQYPPRDFIPLRRYPSLS